MVMYIDNFAGNLERLREKLADVCHKKGINLCMDFVMNHISQDHE